MKILNCAISIAVLACAGCTNCETGAQSAQCPAAASKTSAADAATGLDKRLAGTSWTPTFLKNQGDAKCPAASDDGWGPVFITFGSDGRVNGMSGVNFFGGSCKIGGDGAAEFSQMFSTRRMGPFIDYEGKFLSALAQTDRISLSGGELVFFKGTDALAKFRQIENPKEK